MKTRWAGRCLGTLTLLCARAADAAPERFGERGQLVIDQSVSMSVAHSFAISDDAFQYTTTSYALAPSASYFVLPQVSMGLRAMLGRSRASLPNGETVKLSEYAGAGLSAGYTLSLGDHFALWPSVAGEYSHVWSTPFGDPGVMDHGNNVVAGAQIPVLWVPATHFFVGFGPRVDVVWNGSDLDELHAPRAILGALTEIGGYFEP